MERELNNTKDKLKDIERRIKQQESRARELDQTRAVSERRLHALSGSVDTLQAKADSHRSTDLIKKQKDLEHQNQDKQAKVE